MKNKTQQFINGFTLAEVLITLVIIGVIAALTIPNVINNTKKQEYVSALKKTYSTFQTVTNQIMVEEGTPKGEVGGWCNSVENMAAMYKKRMQIAKDCGTSLTCFGNNSGYLGLNGVLTEWTMPANGGYDIILSDGTIVRFRMVTNGCNGTQWGSNNSCANIYIDVNGSKKPNQFGRDLFFFELREDGLHPTGCESNTCAGTYAYGCSCKVLRENAMNY